MKNIYTIAVAALTLSACSSDNLDLYPEAQLTSGNFYGTETQLLQASNDIYRQLGRIYNVNGIPDLYEERASDNVYIKLASGGGTESVDIVNHDIKTNNSLLENAWNTAYNAVYIINNIVENLEETNISFSDPALRSRLIAESKTIRALIYYNLVQAWGDVPLVLNVISPSESYSYGRESKSHILEQLISDLKESASHLPDRYTGNDVGRITKYAATAVLAKVYLLQGDKTNATAELKKIIDSQIYSLDANNDGRADIKDFAYLFAQDTKNSKESILEVQYLAGENNVNSSHQELYAPWHFSFHLPESTIAFRGSGLNTPTESIITEYEENDNRKDLSLQEGFIDLQTGEFVDYPYTIKFYDSNYLYPGQNFEIIRYADILLLYAELTNDSSYLNQVRTRAGLPEYGSPQYPTSKYPTLADAIDHERRVELAFEFHRFSDLVRTGRAKNELGLADYQLLFPVPQNVIDVNPIITQNAGYN